MSQPAVVFGGPSDEHDISILTGLQACHALRDVDAFYWSKSGEWFQVEPSAEAADFIDGPPRKSRPVQLIPSVGHGFVARRPIATSAVLNCCHGGPGEDGTLQGLFDLAGLPYTGPGQAASAMGMDKLAFGAAMAAVGMPTIERALVIPGAAPAFGGPYIVKPRFGGSSIGIEVVADWKTALALLASSPYFGSGGVAEPFLADSRDLQVAVRTWPSVELSAIEAPTRSGSGIYSYDQKYLAWGGEVGGGRELPARLSDELNAQIDVLSRRVTVAAGLRGVCRIDFLEQGERLWVNEVNTIPGSMAAYLWIDPPISRAELFRTMLDEAMSTPGRRFSVVGADGTALRSAGTIQSKLA